MFMKRLNLEKKVNKKYVKKLFICCFFLFLLDVNNCFRFNIDYFILPKYRDRKNCSVQVIMQMFLGAFDAVLIAIGIC